MRSTHAPGAALGFDPEVDCMEKENSRRWKNGETHFWDNKLNRIYADSAEGMEYFKIHRRGKNKSLVNSMFVCYLIGHPLMVQY